MRGYNLTSETPNTRGITKWLYLDLTEFLQLSNGILGIPFPIEHLQWLLLTVWTLKNAQSSLIKQKAKIP